MFFLSCVLFVQIDAKRVLADDNNTELPRTGLMRSIYLSYELIEAAERERKAFNENTTESANTEQSLDGSETYDSSLPVSVIVKRDYTVVRVKPTNKAVRRGVVMKAAGLPVFEETTGPGCKGQWFRVFEDGWICEDHVNRSFQPPSEISLPVLSEGSITPWPYGFLREDSLEYRMSGGVLEEVREVLKGFGFGVHSTVNIDGENYFKTVNGTLIPKRHAGITGRISTFEGIKITEMKVERVGFVNNNNAYVYSEPSRQKKNRVTKVERYTPFLVLETVGKGSSRFYRFDEGGWLAASDVRVSRPSDIPKGVDASEKWIDVDTDAQIITAYEGDKPVYITMISSGKFSSPTVKGSFRIWAKLAAIAMDNTDDPVEPSTITTDEIVESTEITQEKPRLYSLQDVPWTQFFFESYALHGVYWHDAFGNRRSHGCVNLSPKDAMWFYNWTEPVIPPGFWAVHTTANHPGTLVRVR